MAKEPKIDEHGLAKLRIVSYPDPVLRKTAAPIEAFGEHLARLADRMHELMVEHKGAGLAAPQVGLSWRLFVWNPTGEPQDRRVCINPELDQMEGQVEGEEGCLSFEGVDVCVRRAESVRLTAQLPDGTGFQLTGEGLLARIWQHEIDHLNGRLLIDYMSPADEIVNRRAVKHLEDRFGQSKRSKGTRR